MSIVRNREEAADRARAADGQVAEDEGELEREHRLDQRERAEVQRGELAAEAREHAGEAGRHCGRLRVAPFVQEGVFSVPHSSMRAGKRRRFFSDYKAELLMRTMWASHRAHPCASIFVDLIRNLRRLGW